MKSSESSDDHGKYLCHCGSNYFRSSDRNSDIGIYGKILSKENLSGAERCYRTFGRNPVRCIWIFWIGRTCAIDQRHLPEISLGWKWKQHSDCIYLTWNDDSSTIIGVTESAIRSVPAHYYEGALALGATHERSIFSVVLPAAKSGVVAGIVLGIGRAIGETMAVIMVAGNQARMLRGL